MYESQVYILNILDVLHTVGPRGEYEEHLENCYKSVLALCLKHQIRSVALCGISM